MIKKPFWNVKNWWFWMICNNCGEDPSMIFDNFGWFDGPICCDGRIAVSGPCHGRGLKPTRRSKTSPSTPSVPRDTKALGPRERFSETRFRGKEGTYDMIPWNMIGNDQFMVMFEIAHHHHFHFSLPVEDMGCLMILIPSRHDMTSISTSFQA